MTPINFKQCNVTLKAPPGTDGHVKDLHAYRDGTQHISLWRLSWRERLRILFRGELWLSVLSPFTQPPVVIFVDDPFKAAAKAQAEAAAKSKL